MKIPASKVPAQVWADKARRRADLDEVESMLLSSWDDSKQVYRIGKELWDELRIDEADEVPVDALLRLPYGCIFIERRWVDEYEQLLTDDMADTWGEASCYVTRYYEGCFCWVEGRTLFVDSLTHHCEMRHTDDYGSDVAEVRRGMRMWLDAIELPIDEGISLERWYSEELNVVRKANESMSYACEVTDEELLMTAHSRSYLLEHILGSLLYETRMYEDATAETARVEEVEVSTVTKVHGIWLVFPIEGEYTVSDKEYRIHVPAGTLDMARIGETGE